MRLKNNYKDSNIQKSNNIKFKKVSTNTSKKNNEVYE